MVTVLTLFSIGILIGFLLRKRKRIIQLNDHLTNFAIYLLLFLLGLAVGSNEEIIQNIDEIGFNALLIAFFAVLGSISLAWVLNRFIFKKNK